MIPNTGVIRKKTLTQSIDVTNRIYTNNLGLDSIHCHHKTLAEHGLYRKWLKHPTHCQLQDICLLQRLEKHPRWQAVETQPAPTPPIGWSITLSTDMPRRASVRRKMSVQLIASTGKVSPHSISHVLAGPKRALGDCLLLDWIKKQSIKKQSTSKQKV